MYTFFLTFAALLYSPYFFWQMLVKGKYRNSFFKRLGYDFPETPTDKKIIWIHAVSFGETKAVMPLIRKIKNEHPEYYVLLTTVTETGYAEAKKGSADLVHYLPFDFAIRSIVRKVKPSILILCETDYWFNFMHEAKQNGAYIAVVNGKISDSSLNRFKSVSFFTQKLFDLVDLLIVQNTLYKNRFLDLGIAESKIQIGGNIKLDSDPDTFTPEAYNQFKHELKLNNEPVLVVGSSHDPEESLFIKAFKQAKKEFPDLKMVIVPRHPERFDAVAKMLEESGYPYSRLSKGIDPQSQIILIDAMGQLKKCYQIATLTAVCGSWTDKVGGHNILEPSFYGKAVLFGPYMSTQPDFLNLMKEYGAGLQLNPDEITETLLDLLRNKDKRESIGEKGKMLVTESKGALGKTYEILSKNCLCW